MAHTEDKRLRLLFFGAGLGYVPIIGLVFCTPILLASLRPTRRNPFLIASTLLALALHAALGGTLFYTWRAYQRIVATTPPREVSRAEQVLHAMVRTLEYARSVRGEYPNTLQDLEQWIPSVYFADLWDPSTLPGCKRIYPFYSLSSDGQNYELFGLGPDCEPHTNDDVRPQLSEAESAQVGLKHNP